MRTVIEKKTKKPARELVLRLYVAGNAPNSVRAIANARALCEKHYPARYVLEIVDLIEHPDTAMADGIIVTPTLLKLQPQPVRRLVGNLEDTAQVLLALGSTGT